jgi:hypothetical protein
MYRPLALRCNTDFGTVSIAQMNRNTITARYTSESDVWVWASRAACAASVLYRTVFPSRGGGHDVGTLNPDNLYCGSRVVRKGGA